MLGTNTFVLRNSENGKNYEAQKMKIKRELPRLTSYQKSVLFGTLLGDAYISRAKATGRHQVKFEQRESSLPYVIHLHSLFRVFIHKSEPIRQVIPEETDKNKRFWKERKSYISQTFTNSTWDFYANLFYSKPVEGQKRRKKVPSNIHKWLTPIALAYWYADDGSKESNGIYLHTRRFKHSEIVCLQKALGKNFGFRVSIHKDRHYRKLYIWKESRNEFFEIVGPYLHPTFSYKLDHPFIGPRVKEWYTSQ